jgi:cation:H+ antiporter
MAADFFLLGISFLVIIVGAELFTNGVEWLGVRLRLSEGAVGSVLAAVGTALPETLIPFVALVMFKGSEDHEVGLGAILGAPFMLATLAFFVTGVAAIIYRKRRRTGILLTINRQVACRDLGFFLPLYGVAIAVSFSPIGHWARYAVAIGIFLVYCYYVWLNLRESAESGKEEPLMINLVWAALPLLPPGPPDRMRAQERRELLNGLQPRLQAVTVQVLLALSLIVGGAYIFVGACREAALVAGFSPLVFALVIAPVATELPEKFNSVIWMKSGKDTLALGNIRGDGLPGDIPGEPWDLPHRLALRGERGRTGRPALRRRRPGERRTAIRDDQAEPGVHFLPLAHAARSGLVGAVRGLCGEDGSDAGGLSYTSGRRARGQCCLMRRCHR